MRQIIIALIISIAGLITIFAFRSTPPDEAPISAIDPFDSINRVDVGICIWENTGLRETPGKNGKYITALSFGEKVELLGDTVEVKTDRRSYIKIRLMDDRSGYVYQYLIAEQAALATIVKEMKIYRRPDMMTQKDEIFRPCDIVAVSEKKEEWVKVIGAQRRKSGWIKNIDALSFKKDDIRVAYLFQDALKENESFFKEKGMVQILADPELQSSTLLAEVKKELNAIGLKNRLPDNRLYITRANVSLRTEPKRDEGEVVNWLAEGTLCDVVQIGERETINNMDDYWYEVEVKGKKGWVYGQYTSKGRSN